MHFLGYKEKDFFLKELKRKMRDFLSKNTHAL